MILNTYINLSPRNSARNIYYLVQWTQLTEKKHARLYLFLFFFQQLHVLCNVRNYDFSICPVLEKICWILGQVDDKFG